MEIEPTIHPAQLDYYYSASDKLASTVVVLVPEGQCSKCQVTKRLMTKEGLAYTTRVATQEEISLAKALGHQAFPIVLVNNKIMWSDFRPHLVKALAQKQFNNEL